MELDPEFTFVPVEQKNYPGINDKNITELLEKWGVKDNIKIQQFSFSEPFQPYHKYHFAESFFKNENVAKVLRTKKSCSWITQDIKASSVEIKQLPCTVTNMSFFDKLKDPKNNIIYTGGNLCKRYDIDIDGFLICDNLRGMLLDEECEEYNLYHPEEKEEFIFRIFQILVLGGQLCQYEDELQSYLNVTKHVYKDLVRVKKQENNDFIITTTVLEVVAKTFDGKSYYPLDSTKRQNIAFLCIDPNSRLVTTFLHQFSVY